MDAPENFLNRELSLLAFHKRVLAVAQDESLPLLERLRFLCISSANLDEFFEVRVASVRHMLYVGKQRIGADQSSPAGLLREIREQVLEMVGRQYALLNNELIPALEAQGVYFIRRTHWSEAQREWLRGFFSSNIMPMISPLGIDPAHPFPRIGNKILHFIVSLEGKDAFGRAHKLAIVPAPRSLPRLIRLPAEIAGVPDGFVFLSSIIHAFVEDMFQGMQVTGCYQFRVTRDTELYLDEEEMEDIKLALEGGLQEDRRFGREVRLEVADNCPRDVIDFLLNKFDLGEQDLYQVEGLVNLYRLMSVHERVERPDLKFPGFSPSLPAVIQDETDMFATLRRGDMVLFHPYHAFSPVLALLNQAADDPDVLAIKQTLYRTGEDSPIVQALLRAARKGKEVTVVVELRARFDEEDNIHLAERLQQAGAHVVYGVVGYKTHAKMLMIVRREGRNFRRYVHLGTGNYHPVTSRFYTDIGLLTTDTQIGEDVHRVFQQLTGLGRTSRLKKIVQAPFEMKKRVIEWIDREAEHARQGRPARILAKMNGLEEKDVILALYRASQAGVKIELIVRGICCLRPGVKGLSDNIRVRSVLGRFLEHSRIIYFANGGEAELYCSSADWMERNLLKRVEVCFPIEDARLKRQIVRQGLKTYLLDNTHTWFLQQDGTYRKAVVRPRAKPVSVQDVLIGELTD